MTIDRTLLARQLAATDREIDRLVYELYEEIGIVGRRRDVLRTSFGFASEIPVFDDASDVRGASPRTVWIRGDPASLLRSGASPRRSVTFLPVLCFAEDG